MTDSITINVPSSIPLKRVADLLCTAFEGGVGYWCAITGYTKPDEPRSVWGDSTIFRHVDYPLTGGAVLCQVTDEDEPEKLVLDQAAIERGLKLMQAKAPKHWGDFMGENEDASTGDVFIQLALLGEIVYG